VLLRQFSRRDQRDRVLDVFAAMGHDEAFMRETAESAREHLRDKPVLLLYGQFDPMRFVGAIARFRALIPRATMAIIPWEEHFPILTSAERVAEVVKRWMGSSLGAADR
jgi:pimeloyl-ACP methyl ester carboxylesterase